MGSAPLWRRWPRRPASGPARCTGTSPPGRRCWRPCCRRARRNWWPARRTSRNSAMPPRRCGSGCGLWRTTSAPSAGCRSHSWPRPGHRSDLEDMNRVIAAHKLRPVIDRVFPFDQALDAASYLAGGAHFGKVVISH
ncbi:zinc-binding dehydrogenase [Nonomuraea sp. NPDC048901]|uniref:zinc-binding dehydrogenase n=1 Tax=Nonomuraea sp. NPDC048901 TaxID=3155627 RepID=UPI0033E3B6B4